MKRLGPVFAILVAGYIAVVAALYFGQRSLLYFPTTVNPAPATVGLRDVEVVTLHTLDGESVILWYAQASSGQPTVLFFQGNGGEIGDRAGRFAAYQAAGFGVAFLSYRGYGGSTGSPTEAGLLTDAQAAYDWLMQQGIDPSELVIIGESLGTGVAVQLAAQHDVGALLLAAPFTATADIAARRYFWLPVHMLMKDQFRSIDHIGRVSAPILIQHGTEDRIVPFDLGRRLYEAVQGQATFIAVPGAGHELIFMPRTSDQDILFIRSTLER